MSSLFILLTLAIFAAVTVYRFHYGLFLFFLLLPTYLIRLHIGFLPTTLLEIMFLILTAIWIVKWNKKIIFSIQSLIKKYPTIFAASSLFLLGATISIFTAVDMKSAAGEWKAFYLEPIILFLMLLTIANTKNHNSTIRQFDNNNISNFKFQISKFTLIRTILSALLLCGFATAILAIYQHFTGWHVPYDFWENRDTYRVTAWYGYPNAVGLFLAPLFVLSIYMGSAIKLFKHTKKLKTKDSKLYSSIFSLQSSILKQNLGILFFLVIIPISLLAATIFAKGAGPLLGIIGGTAFSLLFFKKTRWVTIVVGLVGIALLLSLPNTNTHKQEILMQDRSGQIRKEMWAETTAYLFQHPIAGTGLASYATRIAPYRINTHIEIFHLPHNLFLSIWVNTGLLGLFGFVWLLVATFRIAISRILQFDNSTVRQSYIIFLLASLVTILITGLVDTPYNKNDLAMLFWTIVALVLIQTNKQNSSISTHHTSSNT